MERGMDMVSKSIKILEDRVDNLRAQLQNLTNAENHYKFLKAQVLADILITRRQIHRKHMRED